MTTDHAARAGCYGIAGGLLFFAGDMLMYGHFGAGADVSAGIMAAVRAMPVERLWLGGLVGPLAGWLCALGFGLIGATMASGRGRDFVLLIGPPAMVGLGAVHLLWVARGLAIRGCADAVACGGLRPAIQAYWEAAYYAAAIPAYLAALVFAIAVARGRTRCPRWAIFASPALLAFVSPLWALVPAPFGAVLAGGDSNLFLALFFFVTLRTAHAPRD